MISHSRRHLDAPLALADALFGPDPGDQQQASTAAVGKLWSRLATGRSTVLEVRIGWVAGVQYLQFVEVEPDTDKCTASILVQAGAIPTLAEQLATLTRYERGT